jgi:phosphotransferase system enzyme I (PtsI)
MGSDTRYIFENDVNGLRALGLPAVLGAPGLLDRARAGITAVIDGIDGCVVIDPSAETIHEYESRRDAVARERRGLACLRKLPAITRDGVEITLEGKPVTVRTFDLGSEKIAWSLSGHNVEPANPALGLRAIRLSLQDRRLLDPQLAAMLRAASDGPLRILLPVISTATRSAACARRPTRSHGGCGGAACGCPKPCRHWAR